MMVKLFSPHAYAFDGPVATLIKVSSRGLVGKDRKDLEKRASVSFVRQVDQLREKLGADHPLIHVLAFGATEFFGPNRNGDGLSERAGRLHHNTFVKHARWYRDHANKNPAKSYGVVKLSTWNDAMHRAELGVVLNGTRELAERHGGLIADDEMQKLASGKEIAVSMGCRVPNDVCSYCHNVAPTPKDYCDSIENGGRCKAGGLKHHMGSVVEVDGDVHHLHADNPEPTFFDISNVIRPADRTAYVTGMLKAAFGREPTGVELAEAVGLSAPLSLALDASQPRDVQRLLKVAYKLAETEDTIDTYAASTLLAFQDAAMPALPTLPRHGREKFGSLLRALADANICLAPTQFVQLVTGHTHEKSADVAAIVRRELPGVYNRLIASSDLVETLSENPYIPAACAATDHQSWAVKQASDLSLSPESIDRRVYLGALRGAGLPKFASAAPPTDGPAVELAQQYALYKLAFLDSVPESQLTISMAVLQNYA